MASNAKAALATAGSQLGKAARPVKGPTEESLAGRSSVSALDALGSRVPCTVESVASSSIDVGVRVPVEFAEDTEGVLPEAGEFLPEAWEVLPEAEGVGVGVPREAGADDAGVDKVVY